LTARDHSQRGGKLIGFCEVIRSAVVLFSAVNRILRQNLNPAATAQGLRTTDEVVAAIVNYLELMSAAWRSGETPNIPYDHPLCRLAYIYRQVPAQANLFHRVVQECDMRSLSFHEKLRRDVLSIVVFGGGPGTELLGFAKYYRNRANYEIQEQANFEVDVIDHVVGWNENVSWVRNEVDREYADKFGDRRSNWPARFNTNTYTLKFSDISTFGNLTSVFNRDIFILNSVISEVYDPNNLSQLSRLLQKMVAGSGDDAHFLFVDRSDSKTVNKINELVTNLNLEVEVHGDTKGSMDGDEDRSVLKEISDMLQGQQPRTTWDARWVLAFSPKTKLRFASAR
jgi:hypothetical protein